MQEAMSHIRHEGKRQHCHATILRWPHGAIHNFIVSHPHDLNIATSHTLMSSCGRVLITSCYHVNIPSNHA